MATPLVLDNHTATLLVFGPILASALAEGRRFRGDLRRRLADPTYWRLQAWQATGLVLAVVAAKTVPSAALPGPPWLWPALGCAVGIAGALLRAWAIRALGDRFTRYLGVARDHRLVEDGPYRFVRHPSYTGAILLLSGIGIGVGNGISLVVCLTMATIGYVERIRREELLLLSELGEPYARYAARTKRLVPGVW